MMDNNKPEKCKVCFKNYDKELRQPRTLPCGHTFCSQCIKDKINNLQFICPSCHAKHSAKDATQFPINYAVEDFIRNLRDTQVTSVGAMSRKRDQDNTRGTRKKLRSQVHELKSSISDLLSECEESLSQLSMYQGQLRDWKTQNSQLQEKINAATELLEQEETSVVNMTTEGEAGKKQLQTMLEGLNTVNNPQVTTTNDETDHYNVEVENWIQKCRKLFPNVKTVRTSMKVQWANKALETITTETGATAATVFLGDSAATIMEKVKKITDGIHLETLTVDQRRVTNESVKRLVEAGLVFGVQQDKDGLRYSRITLQDGQVYLHVLQHQPPPTNARIFQVKVVLKPLDHSTLVFLDLAWPGSPRRRLHIQLSGDSMIAREFVKLCTGQDLSYSYLNTNVVDSSNYLVCEKPMSIPNDVHQYQTSGSAGDVGLLVNEMNKHIGMVFIITRDGLQLPNIFGKVVKGMEVVKAANHTDITQVTVVDCGVMLTL